MEAALGISASGYKFWQGGVGCGCRCGHPLGLMNFWLLSTVCGWVGLFNNTPSDARSVRYADDSEAVGAET